MATLVGPTSRERILENDRINTSAIFALFSHWFILDIRICLKISKLNHCGGGGVMLDECHTYEFIFCRGGHQYLIHQIYTSLSTLKKSTFTRHYHIKIFSLHNLLNKMVRIDCTTKGVK